MNSLLTVLLRCSSPCYSANPCLPRVACLSRACLPACPVPVCWHLLAHNLHKLHTAPTGVGGWAESGINPAEYSRTLMRVACAYVEGLDTRAVASISMEESSPCASLSSVDGWSALSSMDGASSSGASASVAVDPRAALDAAHKLTRVPGSATACVVQLCPEKRSLIAANLVSRPALMRLFQWPVCRAPQA